MTADHATNVHLTLNGRPTSDHISTRASLADLVRQKGLVGTRVGCEQGVCGSCTVLVDDEPVRACLVLAVQADGCRVETVEGLADGPDLSSLQAAFGRHRALQCGFCTSGFLMLVAGLQRQGVRDEAEVRQALSSNLCRCTGYRGIVAAACEVLADDSTTEQ